MYWISAGRPSNMKEFVLHRAGTQTCCEGLSGYKSIIISLMMIQNDDEEEDDMILNE